MVYYNDCYNVVFVTQLKPKIIPEPQNQYISGSNIRVFMKQKSQQYLHSTSMCEVPALFYIFAPLPSRPIIQNICVS